MNVFVNISHPAHFHFFKNTVRILHERGHHVTIGARKKEFTLDLLKASNLDYLPLTNKRAGITGVVGEMLEQQFKISSILKRYQTDVMLQIGGIFNAPVGKIYRIPTFAFSDTENNKWGNGLSFRLSKHVFSPTCFDREVGGSWKRQIFYPGYHELSYLSPTYVSEKITPEDKFLVRFVGWKAIHDVGERGLSNKQKIEIVSTLNKSGSVFVTSEASLPDEIAEFACKFHPSEIHDFMKTCRMIVGESATMASEAACLGIPAIFISDTGRGYTTEQDKRYGLIKHYRLDQWEEIVQRLNLWASKDLSEEWQKRRWRMLKEKIDVTAWLVDLIENYPKSIEEARKGSFERYYIKCAG